MAEINKSQLYTDHCSGNKNEPCCQKYVDRCIAQREEGVDPNESNFCLKAGNGIEQCGLDFDECVQMAPIFAIAYGEPEGSETGGASSATEANGTADDEKKGLNGKDATEKEWHYDPMSKFEKFAPAKKIGGKYVPYPYYIKPKKGKDGPRKPKYWKSKVKKK